MHRQLHEPVASHRLSYHAVVLWIRIRWRQCLGWIGKTRVWIEAAIQRKIAVRRIEVRMVEDVEGVCLEFQSIAIAKPEILENRHVEAGLERRAEDIAAIRSVSGLIRVAYDCSADGWAARWGLHSAQVAKTE